MGVGAAVVDRRDVLRGLGVLHRRRADDVPGERRDGPASGVDTARGTLFFKISTFAALQKGLDAKQTNLRVWTPDVFGSICFLVSSWLSSAPLRRLRDRDWKVAGLNLAGSVAFGISAATALVQPSTGEPVSAAIANATTTTGALCFLAGALLLGQTPSSSLTSQMSRATSDV